MTNFDSDEYLQKVNLYWKAANYLSVGQLFLRDNPLLKRDLVADDVKIKPIGHWGTIASQNFMYAHLNRVIKKYNLNMFYIEGSGHGGQVMVSNSYLDVAIAKFIQRLPKMKLACNDYSNNSPSQAELLPMLPLKHQVQCMKAASWVIPLPTVPVQFWTTPTSLPQLKLVMGKLKPAH